MNSISQAFADKSIGLLSEQFQISKEVVLKQSLLAFLEKKLRELNSENLKIHGKYEIKSVQEFEELYKQGKIEETNTYEDFQNLDHLEYK